MADTAVEQVTGPRPSVSAAARHRLQPARSRGRAPPTSRAACVPKCAIRCGCSRGNGSSANSAAKMPPPPVTARIAYRHHSHRPASRCATASLRFDPRTMPLETRVEREPIPIIVRTRATGRGVQRRAVRDALGQAAAAVDAAAPVSTITTACISRSFPFACCPPQPRGPLPTPRRGCGSGVHRASRWRAASPMESRYGARCAAALTMPGSTASGCRRQAGAEDARLRSSPTAAATRSRACSCTRADRQAAWVPNHLEYQFAVEAQRPANTDRCAAGSVLTKGISTGTRSTRLIGRPVPVPARCGLAATSTRSASNRFCRRPSASRGSRSRASGRWRNRRPISGKIDTSTTGLLHLLLAEFGLIYSNDWFMLPHPMDINTVCEMRGILVDDTFGRHTFIRAAGRGPETHGSASRCSISPSTAHAKTQQAIFSICRLPSARCWRVRRSSE